MASGVSSRRDASGSAAAREGLRGSNWVARVWWFYVDGFRDMTLGRTLWAIIIVKLLVFFVVLKWLFFPDFLAGKAGDEAGKANYVRQQLTAAADTATLVTSRENLDNSINP